MAKSTRQHVFDGMELLPEGLIPFVEERLKASLTRHWQVAVVDRVNSLRSNDQGEIAWDQPGLLRTMMTFWRDAFAMVLGPTERSYISELLDVRNKLARNEERRKSQRSDITVETVAGLLPWREVVQPHQDVATGDFQQAEFAADLAKVYNGSAPSEYRNAAEFFSRTYLTDGLSTLLTGAAKRLSGNGGDPVVELQTNFGGGKTHSMLALYHMVGATTAQELPGLDQLLSREGLSVPDQISRAVLVGTSRGPQDTLQPEAGQEIRTTWGELAWQLGGQAAFDMIADNDARGIAPGSNLLEAMFRKCAPSLILIDEWVAYLRQIYKVDGLPSGSFDANLSFVQALTEAVKASPQTLLVAALPASQIEVGGEGGQEALARLQQTFSRVESSWRPASQEESYEIVRRRLFKEIPGDKFQHRDNTLKQFAKLYRENPNDFPQGCADEDYRRKLEQAYPIHPDLFDHLYTAWGSLDKFQRTRGVLRLMAQVIHELWMSGDPSVMIMPGNVAIGSDRVAPELLHYLPDAWQSIIASDVDGQNSTPYRIDESAPNLNRYSATRRVARAVFVATAPTEGQENRGIDDKHINLGVVQPGERAAIFGDALRRLSNQANFMHSDHGRCWYSMSASLNRMAIDRAGQAEDALVLLELDKALARYINDLGDRGHFDAVQVAPESSAEVPDEPGGVRAVVLGVAHPHSKSGSAPAMAEIKDMLNQRGNAPRVYRNTLVFLAADARQLDQPKEAMRNLLAWDSIVHDANTGHLDLKTSEIEHAKSKAGNAHETLQTRLKETWCHLLYPYRDTPQAEVAFTASRISAQDGVLGRASKKLVSDEALLPDIGPQRLSRELDKYIWNDKPHLHLKDLWEYLNRYTYLPRLKHRETLIKAVRAAVAELMPGPFAYAEHWDEQEQKYAGLMIENNTNALVTIDSETVIVRPEVAQANRPAPAPSGGPSDAGDGATDSAGDIDQPGGSSTAGTTDNQDNAAQQDPTRFVGTVMLSADRPVRDMHQIVEAIVEQLTTLPGAEVSLTLEIDAEVAAGLDRAKVRTLLENAATLGFIDKVVR